MTTSNHLGINQPTPPDSTLSEFDDFLIKAKEYLHTYMIDYHNDNVVGVDLFDTIRVYRTSLFRYSVTQKNAIAGDHTFRYMMFEMNDLDNLISINRFPMPPTYADFVTIMKILDVR